MRYLILFFFAFLIVNFVFSASVQVKAITPGCGNNLLEPGEACDGSDLGGKTCQSLGFSGGTLSCNSDCTLNTSGCFSAPSGGGGGGAPTAIQTKIIFKGITYPRSLVTLLEDGRLRTSVYSQTDGNFEIQLIDIPASNYVFTLYSEDKTGLRSNLLSFPLSVTPGVTLQVTGIFVSPTIDVDKAEVKKGEPITFFGHSSPNAEVLINVSSEEEIFLKTRSNEDGYYLYNFLTTDLDYGEHFTKSRASKDGLISQYSKAVSFKVSEKTAFKKPAKCPKRGDLNNDCRVNLVDFSIAAYWHKKRLSVKILDIEKQDLNGDGKINLVDFSIMAYYWTG